MPGLAGANAQRAGLALAALLVFGWGGRLRAQTGADHRTMHGGTAATSRLGSGTAWLPDSSPLRAVTLTRGAWMFSFQGAAFAMYDQQYTKRGGAQLALTDWEMAMAMRPLGDGMLHLHLMTSLEAFTLGGSGYPELLQTGGTYRHAFLHDRMHPHSALMEFSAQYERPLGGGLKGSLYVAPVGEPATGPVSFMHRPSAQYDPMAPITHHWQDVSHQSFGVVTLGVGSETLKLEASVFNPRESDETHRVVDYRDAKLDAYTARLSWAPSPRVVVSAWTAYLNAHERLDLTTRMHRYGASVTTQLTGPGGGDWATTFVYGVNVHHHGAGSHALLHGDPNASPHHPYTSLLLESSLALGASSAVFARAEYVEKNGEELGFLGGDLTVLNAVRGLTLGATRRVAAVRRLEISLGARASATMLPKSLELTYGTRTPVGLAVYTQLRPTLR